MPDVIFNAALILGLGALGYVLTQQQRRQQDLIKQLDQAGLQQLQQHFDKLILTLKDDAKSNRDELGQQLSENRRELRETLNALQTQQQNSSTQVRTELSQALDKGSNMQEERLKALHGLLEQKLSDMMQANERKLEQMRQTVDEKLQSTLEKRLSESFKLVSTNLEAVNQGLGEMKNLANGVGDLKKVLSNVKTRGTLGEIQLATLLEETLATSQYERNVKTKQGSSDMVEFAIKLPGKDIEGNAVFLPIDSKFPLDVYDRLLTAYENANADAVKLASKELEQSIKNSAKDIQKKYIDPPHTTDFAILFLPIEGLYAEVVRQPSLLDSLQREHRIVITGPSTLIALLNTFQMGFQTLNFEKRSKEIREILSAVKKEFQNFGTVLSQVQNKISGASSDLDKLVGTRTRQIESKLRSIELGSEASVAKHLGASTTALIDDDGE